MDSLFRMMFGTVVRAGIYRGMRKPRGVLLIGICTLAAVGYALLAK